MCAHLFPPTQTYFPATMCCSRTGISLSAFIIGSSSEWSKWDVKEARPTPAMRQSSEKCWAKVVVVIVVRLITTPPGWGWAHMQSQPPLWFLDGLCDRRFCVYINCQKCNKVLYWSALLVVLFIACRLLCRVRHRSAIDLSERQIDTINYLAVLSSCNCNHLIVRLYVAKDLRWLMISDSVLSSRA